MSKQDKRYSYYLTPSIKRHLIGSDNIKPIGDDYLDKQLDRMLSDIIGHPGKSIGSSGEKNAQNTMSGIAGGTSAYSSGQVMADVAEAETPTTKGGSGIWAAIINGLFSLVGMAHADIAAEKSYERQNEYYGNHLSMPAKVQEYNEAGLNPMALAGAGVGATSAPSVDTAQTPSMDGIGSMLSSILSYRLGKKQLEVEQYKAETQATDVASQIEYRAEQKIYQQKINDWFEVNQQASLDKIYAETEDALQRVRTGEADEALKLAGYEKTQVEAALIAEQALYEQWKNSPEWRSIELGLKRAQANANNANAAHAYEDIKNLGVQRDNLIADTALKYAQTDKGRQELINLGYTEEQLKFAVEHQRGDLIFDRISKVAGAVKDVGVGAAGVVSAVHGGIGAGAITKTATATTNYDKNGKVISSTRTISGTKKQMSKE